jgi:DNA repair protein SbcC/Rad50
MIPISLKLSNFTSYGDNVPELDFTKFHLAAISGSNGAGKSSILDAITWVLWGWARTGDSSDQLVRLGAGQMYVEFSFELDGHLYTVKRSRSIKGGGSTALELWSNSHNLTEGTIKSTQQKIIDTLHLTFETFTNSSFLRQGHADEFTTKGPTDRKRILADILGLAHYDKLEEKAKDKIKEADNKLKLLEYQLIEIEAELSQKEQSQEKKISAEKKITEVEVQINILEKDLKSLTEQKASLVATNEQQTKLKQTLNELQTELDNVLLQGKSRAEKIKQLESELLELPTFDEKLKELKVLEKEKEDYSIMLQKKLELENKLTSVKSTAALKNQEKQTIEKKLSEALQQIEDLAKESAKCPTCGQEMDKEHKQKVNAEFKVKSEEFKGQLLAIKTTVEEEEIEKLEVEINSIKLDDHKYQATIQKINELSTLQEKREKLIAAEATLVSERKVVLELRELFANKKSQIEKLEVEVKKLPDLEGNLATLESAVNQKESELTGLKLQEREARNLLGQATELISRVEQMEKLDKQRREERSLHQKEKENFEELALAFGKKGIQAMIIETAIPEIEEEANNLLGKLTSGRMKIRLETQKETKTKVETSEGKMHATVETLDIIISDEMGERPYENFSGGEQFRVNVAIRLALSKLLTRRAGAKLQFLILDEGFGTQDAEGRTRIVEVLDTIKNDFEKIVVITHLEELKEEFPTRIEVSKNASGSTFTVVGS